MCYQSVCGLLEGMGGKIAQNKINNGSDADMKYMLDMRNNLVHHVPLLTFMRRALLGTCNGMTRQRCCNIVAKVRFCSMSIFCQSVMKQFFVARVVYLYINLYVCTPM
jgi:hypothetical protein